MLCFYNPKRSNASFSVTKFPFLMHPILKRQTYSTLFTAMKQKSFINKIFEPVVFLTNIGLVYTIINAGVAGIAWSNEQQALSILHKEKEKVINIFEKYQLFQMNYYAEKIGWECVKEREKEFIPTIAQARNFLPEHKESIALEDSIRAYFFKHNYQVDMYNQIQEILIPEANKWNYISTECINRNPLAVIVRDGINFIDWQIYKHNNQKQEKERKYLFSTTKFSEEF